MAAGAGRRRWILWMVGASVALFLGIAWTAAFVGTGVATRVDIEQADVHPEQATALVVSRDWSGDVLCLRYPTDGGDMTSCIYVDDSTAHPAGSTVRVRFARAAPQHVVVVGDADDPWPYPVVGLLAGGFELVGLGLLGLSRALDQRAEPGEPFRSWWVVWACSAGLTTWVGFLQIGVQARRRRWLVWSGVYLVGIVVALALEPLTPGRRPGNTVGVVLFAVVALGGMVHTMAVRRRANDAIVVAGDRPRPPGAQGLLVPPAPVALPHGSYPTPPPWR